MMSVSMNDAESLGMGALSLLLIGPYEERRRTIAAALSRPQASVARELTVYPEVDDLASILDKNLDAVVVDLDPDPERALDVVENICAQNSSLIVMVYSARAESELLVRCMRAGAREFLAEPLRPSSVAEALVRTSARREEVRRQKKVAGKLLVFAGAKGGSGVTTAASNFAVSLAKQSVGNVVLVDLDFQLGDAALTLGLTPKFSSLDAMENVSRLDSDFLSALLVKHSSGLSVLAAPDALPHIQPSKAGVEKLLRLLREDFAYVVVDGGSHPGDMHESLFEAATAVYLVTQVGVADLRNANRFVSRYFSDPANGKLEIILNRFQSRNLEIDQAAITKALTQPAKWKIPNDFAAARRAQNTGIAMASETSHIAKAFDQMANAASGNTVVPERKKKFSLFG